LHNAASLQQRVLPLKGNSSQADASNTETKSTKVERISKGGLFGNSGNGIALSADGSMLAVGTTHSVILWDLSSGQIIRSFESHSDALRSLYFTEDNRHLIDVAYTITYVEGDTAETLSFGGDVKEQKFELSLWDIDSGEQINKIEQDGSASFGMEISGNTAITFAGDQTYQQDIYTGKPVQRFPALAQVKEKSGVFRGAYHLPVNQPVLIDLSQNARASATRGYADKVFTWDLQTGAQLSEDNNVLLAYGRHAFQAWDLQEDKTFLFPTAMPMNIDAWSQSVAMSRDGKAIATLSTSAGIAFVWHLP